jgi:hypothetical protein
MDEFSTTRDTPGQADEDILTYTVSDEGLEAAAGTELRGEELPTTIVSLLGWRPPVCC